MRAPMCDAALEGNPLISNHSDSSLRLLGVLAALASSLPACANDGFGELGLGGVITVGKTEAVSMQKEVREISPARVRVDCVFQRQKLAAGQSVPVLFPLPLYSAEQPSWAWAGAPRDFSVSVDGQPQPFQTVVKAWKNRVDDDEPPRGAAAVDVSAVLREAGLSDAQIALFPSASPFVDAAGQRPRVPPPRPRPRPTARWRAGASTTS